MPRGLNKVMVIGNLGADPEVRYTPGGQTVANFRMASTRRWRTPEGEDREATEWFRVVAWGRLAEICQGYLRKGSQVYVEGRLQTRNWLDNEGNTRYSTEVVAQELIMLGSRDERPAQEDETDEIPF